VSAGLDFASAHANDRAADATHDADTSNARGEQRAAQAQGLGPNDPRAADLAAQSAQAAGAARDAQRAAGHAESDAKRASASGKAVETGGQAVAAALEHAAARTEVRAAAHGQHAELARQSADDAGEAVAQATRRGERLVEALSQLAQARAEASRNATA
jgi:hypothetical protein